MRRPEDDLGFARHDSGRDDQLSGRDGALQCPAHACVSDVTMEQERDRVAPAAQLAQERIQIRRAAHDPDRGGGGNTQHRAGKNTSP